MRPSFIKTSSICLLMSVFALVASACATSDQFASSANSALSHTDLPDEHCPAGAKWSMALHGGAGVITRDKMSAEKDAAYRSSLTAVLERGGDLLSGGASALDTVEATVRMMEDDEKFNAGKGAVFSAAGLNELDAAIMDGRNLNAGAVASVTTVRNPISLARLVMDKSRHVMLIGEGAEGFAESQGMEPVDNRYFFTQRRWDQMQKKKAGQHSAILDQTRFGTVGVVVKDGCGNLAAGTSTGGLTAKQFGRVGDTPIIGAGTYADNRYCAVSATGTGEYFIRANIAHDVCARINYKGEGLQSAMDGVIHGTLTQMGGDGGIVALGANGQVGFSFNTPGMYRGSITSTQPALVKIYKDE